MPVKSDERRRSDLDFIRVDEEAFLACPERVGRLRGHGTHGRYRCGADGCGLERCRFTVLFMGDQVPTPPRATFAMAM